MLPAIDMTAQEPYGIYNYPQTEASSPLIAEAERWSDDLVQDLSDSLEILESELVAMYYRYMRIHTCSPEEMTRMEQNLLLKNREIENFKEIARARYEKDKVENDSLIKENLTMEIHRFMRENKLLFLSQHDKVIICNACKDYTNELIAWMRRPKASAATAADR